MKEEQVNWEELSESQALSVFRSKATTIVVEEMVKLVLICPYVVTVTLRSEAYGYRSIELKKEDMEITICISCEDVFGTLKVYACGEMELPLVQLDSYEDYKSALSHVHCSAVFLIGAFVRFNMSHFFDFVSSYDDDDGWYDWMECFDRYELYCTGSQ